MLDDGMRAVERALEVAIDDGLDLRDRLLCKGNVLNHSGVINERPDWASALEGAYALIDCIWITEVDSTGDDCPRETLSLSFFCEGLKGLFASGQSCHGVALSC